jgi:tetratricopeptide (TPR) repeat protein
MLHKRIESWGSLVLLGCLLCIPLAAYPDQKNAAPAKPSSQLAQAAADLKRNNLDSAEKTLWNVLSTEPANQEALTMLGVIRGRQQRFAEAEALFRRVVQLNPKSLTAVHNLAGALLAQDKADEALKEYQHAVELAPQDVGLRIEAAQLELARGGYAQALAFLDGIKPAQFPPEAVPYKAASLIGLDRKSDAEALIPLVETTPSAAVELAQVFIEANDGDAGLKCLSYTKPANKTAIAGVDYLRGRALRLKGENEKAQAAFRRALAADPKSVPSMLASAEVLAAENKHAESYRTLEQARKVDPQSVEVLRYMVVEAMRAGLNENALKAATELQKLSPALDDRYLVSTVLVQQKQYLPASHILEDYVAQRPQDAKAYLALGMSYLAMLHYAEAQKALERALQLDSRLAEAEYQLGLLESQQGRREEARQHWERAVELKPDHAGALFSLGTILMESGQLPQAESAFERSLAADPGNMKTEYNLALVLNKLGRSDEAKIHFERYRRMQEAEHSGTGNQTRNSPM